MSKLTKQIKGELKDRKVISFARFMELALYAPNQGFYEKNPEEIGRRGSYITSVSVGPLLGQLLAFQCARWLANISSGPPTLVEAGAHRGCLAKDILDHLAEYEPATYRRLQYIILEPSERRQRWQAERLSRHIGRIKWVQTWRDESQASLSGIIFSNELLDAFPIHRLAWDAKAKKWFEWGVTEGKDNFTWARLPHFDEQLLEHASMAHLKEIQPLLPDQFILEVAPQASRWWTEASLVLREGILLTLDYGYETSGFPRPERINGTLRAYYKQTVRANVLEHVGDQDLTAHVNFTQLQQSGCSVGMETMCLESQHIFLTRIATQTMQKDVAFPAWNQAMKRQFLTLSHPNQFGQAFQVLAQRRQLETPDRGAGSRVSTS